MLMQLLPGFQTRRLGSGNREAWYRPGVCDVFFIDNIFGESLANDKNFVEICTKVVYGLIKQYIVYHK